MQLQKLAESLHPFERKVVPLLKNNVPVSELIKKSKLDLTQVTRALQWLENKKVLTLAHDTQEVIDLDKNGTLYKQKGLPEKRFLTAIKDKPLTLNELAQNTDLERQEIGISMGTLRSKQAITVEKGKDTTITITDQGKKILEKGFLEETFLNESFPIPTSKLKPEQKHVINELKKRKQIIKVEEQKTTTITLTDLGKKLTTQKLDDSLLESVTPQLIKSEQYKGKKFRRYDVAINVPKIFAGKKQHYRRFLDEVRQKFIALGFKECFGPLVETEFWDMDALYMPQFHSARDIHEGYQVADPSHATTLPKDKVKAVKDAHESGKGTTSSGWQYAFSDEQTHRHILRTHDTSISARTLASQDLEVPGKYFQIARCFRYDVIDATHLSDFNQVGGFVIEEGINFRHLKGLLKMFAEEFADTDQIKLTPGYFPFTEPSVELHAKHPKLGWVELAGAGIFRPELVKPLVGREVPVIAWGVGLDRLAMFKLGIKDIRQLFSHDLEFLRTAKVV